MKSCELVVLLPCHSLADFPFYHEGTAADNLLGCYSALWHPALLAASRRMPSWRSSNAETEELADKFVLVPRVCRDDLPGFWSDEARSRGALLLETEGEESRPELVRLALEALEIPLPSLDESTVADFHALGTCHLLVELLTVQMRYSSLIDEEHFSRQLVAAAEAALEGDTATAHDKLAACFDALSEARGHFYPVEAFLVDLTLVAATTVGSSLLRELNRGLPGSLLISGEVLSRMAEREPATLEALRQAVDERRVSLVGGEYEEGELPLHSPEQVLDNLQRGLSCYERFLGQRPRIFGRRRYGLSPILPQILESLNFVGALHVTLDDGRFPQARQSISRWAGAAGSGIDALFRLPLDAEKPESILTYPQQMSSAMDMDHVAIVSFAHWPNRTSPWYEDIRRSAAFAPTVGRFVTLDKLLEEAGSTGQQAHFATDEYRAPYLAQHVAEQLSDPLSSANQSHRAQATLHAISTIGALATLVGGKPPAAEALPPDIPAAAGAFAAALQREKVAAATGYLVVNALSFGRRAVVDVDALEQPPVIAPPVVAAVAANGKRQVVVDLPSMGYAWLAADPRATWKAPTGKPLVEGLQLRNETCEVSISPKSGGIQSIFTPGHRGNRLSQQLALRRVGRPQQEGTRWREPDETAQYSTMVAEKVEISISGPAVGEIVSRGHLIDESSTQVARFQQRTRVERGSSLIWIDVELEPLVELAADPWNEYFAARFAWSGAPLEVFRGVGLTAELTTARRLEAPTFVEVHGMRTRTAILTGGVPYHRLVGDSTLDSLLLVRGESARRFRLGIGLDLPYPQMAAMELVSPPVVLQEHSAPPLPASAWLFHVDAKNVLATHWEPRVKEGRVVGLRVRLLETAGRPVRCALHTFRGIASARRLDLLGNPIAELKSEPDKVAIDMAAGQWVYLELDWN